MLLFSVFYDVFLSNFSCDIKHAYVDFKKHHMTLGIFWTSEAAASITSGKLVSSYFIKQNDEKIHFVDTFDNKLSKFESNVSNTNYQE